MFFPVLNCFHHHLSPCLLPHPHWQSLRLADGRIRSLKPILVRGPRNLPYYRHQSFRLIWLTTVSRKLIKCWKGWGKQVSPANPSWQLFPQIFIFFLSFYFLSKTHLDKNKCKMCLNKMLPSLQMSYLSSILRKAELDPKWELDTNMAK